MYIVTTTALAFQRTDPDNPRLPVGDEDVVTKGNPVPDYVTEFTIAALASSGLIAFANTPMPQLSDPLPPQYRSPEQPDVLPSDPSGQPLVVGDRATATDGGTLVVMNDGGTFVPQDDEIGGPAAPLPDLPKTADSKETWENYAQLPAIGMTQGEAEAMNKTDLMAAVKQRYAAATA